MVLRVVRLAGMRDEAVYAASWLTEDGMTDQHAVHLVEAQRHVVEGEQRVTEQIVCITELARDGHDRTDAQALLATLNETLACRREHLSLLVAERYGDTG